MPSNLTVMRKNRSVMAVLMRRPWSNLAVW